MESAKPRPRFAGLHRPVLDLIRQCRGSSVVPEQAIQHERRIAHAKSAPAVQEVRSSKREQTVGNERAGKRTGAYARTPADHTTSTLPNTTTSTRSCRSAAQLAAPRLWRPPQLSLTRRGTSSASWRASRRRRRHLSSRRSRWPFFCSNKTMTLRS